MTSYLFALSSLFGLLAVVLCGPGADHEWGYDEGNGPDTWQGKCQNHLKQSPIDIRAPDVDYALLHRMHFLNYDMDGIIELSNTGRTLFASGFEKWQHKQPMIQGGGLRHRYKLAQFHLHWGQNDAVGSEHALGSLHYPAELHLVHVREGLTIKEALSRPDGLAVVGVFLTKTTDPIANNFSPISEKLHDLKHSGNKTELKNFRTKYVLPLDTEAFYRYEGSLTTPDCSEAVIWTIIAEPLAISSHQLHLLRQLHNKELIKSDKNYRPLQPLNGRRVQFRPSKLDRAQICSVATNISILTTVAALIIAQFF
uniref:Carbonic anhydrase n=1 Tax=Caenorhabditis japonica TaxID=281687 RepID=A0A8R1HR45_CAEJA